jgi:tetratricopeptide (TPR) repeat protein
VGRNDPCPCGSGKKYKRCCYEKDRANKVTRIAPEEADADSFDMPITAQTVYGLLQGDYWENPTYLTVARQLVSGMKDEYDWETIGEAVVLWSIFSRSAKPEIRKTAVFPASLEYFIAQLKGRRDVTLTRLAGKYGVSATTISQRYREILAFTMGAGEQYWGNSMEEAENDEEFDELPLRQSRMTMEQTLAAVERLLEEREFSSEKEVQAFLARLNEPQNAHFLDRKPSTPAEQAQDLLYDAWDEPSPAKRVRMARKALKLYPDSADAWNILAETEASSAEEALIYYQKGMEAGERDLGKAFIEENKGHFWGIVRTRPYMRAKFGYACTLHELGRLREAVRQYEQLLELNPNDNQGVRYQLIIAHLELGEYEAADKLLNDTYRDECSAEFNYNRILVEYGLHGFSPALSDLFREAVELNPYVPEYLTGQKRLPRDMPEFFRFGDRDEAVLYAGQYLHLWRRQPELLKWIRQQLRSVR